MKLTALLEALRSLVETSKYKRGTAAEQRRRREISRHQQAAAQDRDVTRGSPTDPRKIGRQPTKGRYDVYYVVLKKRVLRFSRANWEESVKRTLAAGAQRLYGGKDLKKGNSKTPLLALEKRNSPQDRIYKNTIKWSMSRWEKEAKALGISLSQMTPELVSDASRSGGTGSGNPRKKTHLAKADRAISAAESEARQERGRKPKRLLRRDTDKSWPLGGARFVYGKVADPVVIDGVAYYTGSQLIKKFGLTRGEVTKLGKDKRTERKLFRTDKTRAMVVLVPVDMIEQEPDVTDDDFPTAKRPRGLPIQTPRVKSRRGPGQRGKRRR